MIPFTYQLSILGPPLCHIRADHHTRLLSKALSRPMSMVFNTCCFPIPQVGKA